MLANFRPDDNVGIATGDGLLVLDEDVKNGKDGSCTRSRLEQQHGPLPKTWSVRTTSGGQHYYFSVPDGVTVPCSVGKLGEGLDVRGDGGYVVAPGSVVDSNAYEWSYGCSPHECEMAACPPWPIELAIAPARQASATRVTAEGHIPEGSRNSTLASMAGTLRANGFGATAIEAALQDVNATSCTPPLPMEEVSRIAESIGRYPPGPLSDSGSEAVRKYSFGELLKAHSELKSPVVDGLFREGEIANLISHSKVGKSWLAYCLLLSVAQGRPWLGRFATRRGRVLLIDNELHASQLAYRIPLVAKAMRISPPDYADQLDIWPLRGNLRSLAELEGELAKFDPGHYTLIVFDAKYRFAEPGASENDNAAETRTYNRLDRIAERSQAALALVHHTTKGDQGSRRVTDVGAGAGAQSRAADCHLVLREHEEPGAVVLDAAVRSFPPVAPMTLRFNFPLWGPDEDLDPNKVRGRAGGRSQKQIDMDQAGMDAVIEALQEDDATVRVLMEKTSMGRERVNRLMVMLEKDGKVLAKPEVVRGNPTKVYQLAGMIRKKPRGTRCSTHPPTSPPT